MDIQTSRICTLLVTRSCNLNCVYCFEQHKNMPGKKMMEFDTAIAILTKEFEDFRLIHKKGERLAIEFFGGEPLLNFSLIKQVWEWVKQQHLEFPYVFQITTNGTLLTPTVREWLTERKDDFRVILSVDGDEIMQAENRGCSIADIPIGFVRDTWEKSYFKMTLSHETLPNYARGVISLSQNGFRIASSLAEGTTWNREEALIYRDQLTEIANYFLKNPNVKPEHPFDYIYKELIIGDVTIAKNCGVGTTIATYDTDGRKYPCHLFLPIVHGNDDYEKISNLDFTANDSLITDECVKCPIVRLCRTCYGYNYLERGHIAKRDKSRCKMYLIEAQVVSAFQINYLMAKQDTCALSAEELLMLKSAVICYEKTKDISIDSFVL